MKNFEAKYKDMGNYKKLESFKIDSNLYTPDQLSFESVELLTAMAYYDYEMSIEYFDSLSQILGYETVIQAILDLQSLGAIIATAKIYRQLVIKSSKNKYKGMMRQ